MDTTRLRYFVAIAQRRSFRSAAHELHITQPALSRHIKLLEQELGVQLLARTARGVAATEAGLMLLHGAQRLFDFSAELRARVCSLAVTPTGLVRVGVQPAFATHFLTKVLVELQRDYPHVHFHVVEALSERLRDLILSDQIDIAVVSGLAPHPELEFTPLYVEEVWLIGSRNKWTPPRRKVQPAYLKGRPLIASSLLKPVAEEAIGPGNVTVSVEIEGSSAIGHLIKEGAGLYLGPPTLLWDQLKTGGLIGVPVETLRLRRLLIRRKDRPESAAAALFVRRITEAIASFSAMSGSPIRLEAMRGKKARTGETRGLRRPTTAV